MKLTDKERRFLGDVAGRLHCFSRSQIRGTKTFGHIVSRKQNRWWLKSLEKKGVIEVHPYYHRSRYQKRFGLHSNRISNINVLVKFKWTPEIKKIIKQERILRMLAS